MKPAFIFCFACALLLTAKTTDAQVTSNTNASGDNGSQVTDSALRLRCGVNFGNMLEAPNEGDWGLRANDAWFKQIKDAGFDHVRLPISWGYHTAQTAPYKIDPALLDRVEHLAKACLDADLKLLINCHHDPNLNQKPVENKARFLAMWKQIAERFRGLPEDRVAFELLNEPHDTLAKSPGLWNGFVVETLKVVRQTNPDRTVVVGPINYNSISSLNTLELPDDPNVSVTVHYYLPFDFTHQGAQWVSPPKPTGIQWDPKETSIANGWRNESWQTTTKGNSRGLEVEYQAGWAGIKLRSGKPHSRPLAIELQTDAAVKIQVSLVNGDKRTDSVIVTEPNQTRRVKFDSDQMGESFDTIYLQNNTPKSQPAFTIRKLALIYADETQNLLGTANDSIISDLATAAEWGKKHNRVIYLGEFGAYQAADIESRQRWTAAVRSAAESLQMDWSYWEFAAGFGIFDPDKQMFKQPLLDALKPRR
ncbi:glycoside hydrolase family 5 protein [Stieleria sp. JC731]|uniref:glycoside hydrolase family 5 protein n=1 Tax=Pirellulaceae TaxID=2691357 RepID=UPI001E5D7B30|nr:glycoside hydrolase family 5 protein [Stieleria sp. JC731]MCC9601190.1 glycoside hydrolase family 5 protein [Stieleria sp. JC731]